MGKKIISYVRVSTQKQGSSGLGLEAQKQAVRNYINETGAELIGEFLELESGKKSDLKRPQLEAALNACKKDKAVLVVAKLDRLARNVHFISGLMQAKVKFIALDIPEANELTIHIMAAFAEHEAKRISERTKAALAIAKSKGVVLGAAGYMNLKPNIETRKKKSNEFASSLSGLFHGFKLRKITQSQMAIELNNIGVKTINGGLWRQSQVNRIIKKINKIAN